MPDLEETVDFGKWPTIISIRVLTWVKVYPDGHFDYRYDYNSIGKNRRVKKLIKEMKDA